MKTNDFIEKIRTYLKENPDHGPANIARKFKMKLDMADNYYHYCRLLDDPEPVDTVYIITNYQEYQYKKSMEQVQKDINEKKHDERNKRFRNRHSNPISTLGINI